MSLKSLRLALSDAGSSLPDQMLEEVKAVEEVGSGEDRVPKDVERAMVIAYTALWQLRDLAPKGEPDEFRETRLELRRRLDAIDDDAASARHLAPL